MSCSTAFSIFAPAGRRSVDFLSNKTAVGAYTDFMASCKAAAPFASSEASKTPLRRREGRGHRRCNPRHRVRQGLDHRPEPHRRPRRLHEADLRPQAQAEGPRPRLRGAHNRLSNFTHLRRVAHADGAVFRSPGPCPSRPQRRRTAACTTSRRWRPVASTTSRRWLVSDRSLDPFGMPLQSR